WVRGLWSNRSRRSPDAESVRATHATAFVSPKTRTRRKTPSRSGRSGASFTMFTRPFSPSGRAPSTRLPCDHFRVLLFAVALGLLSPGASSAPRTPLVRYELVEARHALTPRGESDAALAGAIAVAGERARWELNAGAFPRSSATAVVSDRGGLTFLDTRQGVAAAATRQDFDALFAPKA